jgi:Bacterial Ig-like domain (group 3)/FG-GAP-like repeat
MSRNSRLLPALLAIAIALPIAAHAAAISTTLSTTTLTISSSSVVWPAAVTLTASVVAAGAPVTAGTVTFCDASALKCEDAAIVGRAQLAGTNATATLKFIPGSGVHTYQATFSATSSAAKSTSNTQAVTVTGFPTATKIAVSGNPSGYTLTATVTGVSDSPPTLSGTVSFEDTSNGNVVLGTASLGPPGPAVETFVQATTPPMPTGNQPAAGASADFDGDGIPDLAIMASASNAVFILKGNGDGTFRQLGSYPVGTLPCVSPTASSNCSMAVGDFNHDGAVDLAVTSAGDNTVTILLGHTSAVAPFGDGTFTQAPGSPFLVGSFPVAVRTGDFNDDGTLDLAVANANDNTVSILLGNGDGTFTAVVPAVPTGGKFPLFLAVADFNQDGFDDIAVSNNGQNANTVSVLLGVGDGTFVQAPGSPIPGFTYDPAQIVAADFNGDGYPDLAVADFYPFNANLPQLDQTSDVVILLGNPNGSGTFTPAQGSPITVGLYAFAMVGADFNQDGHTDLAVDNYGTNNIASTQALTILVGDGKGGFTQPLPTTQLGNSPNDLIAADFNGDGTTDLAIPNVGEFDTTILLNEFTQTATASVSNITVGGTATHLVDAVYGGNTYFAPSTSTPIPLQGLQVNTSLTLTANLPEQMLTMPVTFTAQLASLSNLPPFATPTGTVSFFDQSLGGQLLGTAAMGANGQAAFTTTSIGPGVHMISASYAGDATFLPSSSNQITEQIDDLLINRVGNNNTTIVPGTTVIYTLQVAPAVATKFLYTVSFSASGLPAGASASFSPALAAGSTTAKITMTVTTATTSFNARPPSPFERLPLTLGLLLPLCGSKAMRRRMRKIPPLLTVALLAVLGLAAVAGLSGCSGAGLFAAQKVTSSITVTATEGTLSRSTTVPLAIQ